MEMTIAEITTTGIFEIKGDKTTKKISKKKEWKRAKKDVFARVFNLVILQLNQPTTHKPPNKEEIILADPCDINSLLPLCLFSSNVSTETNESKDIRDETMLNIKP